MSRLILRSFLPSLFALLLGGLGVSAQASGLVDIRAVDSTIVVELRYATSRNCVGRPLYSPTMPALVRPEVARRLARAQAILRPLGLRLKIWDAYRPKQAHEQLWQRSPMNDYVADPAWGGSLHTYGVAVDATLVDSHGRDLKMPTDFDDFSASALLNYTGSDDTVRRNLRILQGAMGRAGFYGVRTEWWHFVSTDWKNYRTIPQLPGPEMPALRPAPPLVWQRPTRPRPTAAVGPRREAGGGASARGMATRR